MNMQPPVIVATMVCVAARETHTAGMRLPRAEGLPHPHAATDLTKQMQKFTFALGVKTHGPEHIVLLKMLLLLLIMIE